MTVRFFSGRNVPKFGRNVTAWKKKRTVVWPAMFFDWTFFSGCNVPANQNQKTNTTPQLYCTLSTWVCKSKPISCQNKKKTQHNSTTGKKVPPAHAKQVYLNEPLVTQLKPGLTWRNRRLPSPTRINLEEPVRVASPTRINLFLCLSVCKGQEKDIE